jgi:virulence factor Mce-like protein
MNPVSRVVGAIAITVGLTASSVVAIRASYGAFRSGYRVSGGFERASYGIEPGVQVEHHGIPVGKVDSVRLVSQHAELTLTIFDAFRVPATVVARVRPRSIFGDPYVDLDFPDSAAGPFLSAGSRLRSTAVEADVGDLIASAVPLLRDINPQDLAAIIEELGRATDGQGTHIAAAIDSGTQLADLLASTMDAQLQALDSFARFQAAIAPTGPSFNAIAANANVALPTLNDAEAALQRALDTLNHFAGTLATLLAAERPDIHRLLDNGASVTRLLTRREPQLEQVISGLSNYVFKFAAGRSPEVLPNGSRFAYFKNFVLIADVNALICATLQQAGPAGATVMQVLGASGGPISCAPQSPAAVTAGGQRAASDLTAGIDQVIASPDVPQRMTVQSLVDHILGRS